MSDKMFSDEAFLDFQTKYGKLKKDIEHLGYSKLTLIGLFQNVVPIEQQDVNSWWEASQKVLDDAERVKKDIESLREVTRNAVAGTIPFEEHAVPVKEDMED